MEERLEFKNLPIITRKYLSKYRKHRFELVDEPKKQQRRVFLKEESAIKVIMDCRTTAACKFRARLRFKQCDIILTKE